MNDRNFKQTENGQALMKWEVVRLGDVTNLRNEIIQPEGRNYKFVGLEHIEKGENRVKSYDLALSLKSSKFRFYAGDVLYGKLRPYLDKAVIADFDGICSTDLLVIDSDKNKVHPNFLIYVIHSTDFISHAVSTTSGTNHPRTSWKAIGKYKFKLPPLHEQKKIAEILLTVDQAIEKADGSIEKTQRLKNGLMQELLTNGIGHKEFKDTEVGRIPKEWEIAPLKEVVDINKETRDPKREFPGKTFSYIDIDSIENGTGIIKGAKEILGKEAPSRARRLIRYYDVLMSTVRPYLKAFAIIPTELHGQICSTGFAVLTCKERLLPLYLLNTLFNKPVINQCNKMMVGAQYPALNSSQVEKITIPVPPLTEQQKIAEILGAVDGRLELLRKRKERLERIKKGLMNDLLTGRMRVKIS